MSKIGLALFLIFVGVPALALLAGLGITSIALLKMAFAAGLLWGVCASVAMFWLFAFCAFMAWVEGVK